jgi:hypothetical protein
MGFVARRSSAAGPVWNSDHKGSLRGRGTPEAACSTRVLPKESLRPEVPGRARRAGAPRYKTQACPKHDLCYLLLYSSSIC